MYTPKFVISNKILKNMGQVEAAKEIIENSPLIPSFEKQFQSDAVVRTVYHGTHIEGNDLTWVQTKKVLEGLNVYGRPRDIQEVINYRNVVGLIDELTYVRGGYTLEMLTDIHKLTVEKIVPEDKAGVLRVSQVVVKEEGTGEVIFSPPPFVEVPYLLEDFFIWLNSEEAKELHPVLRAGITHYILVAVHPFVEGNGRTVRAFTALILLKEGYDVNKFFSLEEHFDSDPAAYYEALSLVDKQAKNLGQRDLTLWLEYFSEAVAVELVKIKEKVQKLSVDTKLKTRFGQQITVSERQMRLFEYMGDKGSATMQELKKVLSMVSEDTILRDVTDMMKKGIIRKEGSTKAARYIITGR